MACITETRILRSEDVRTLCIEHDWYTRGDVRDYMDLALLIDNMFDFSNQEIYLIARNIQNHSVTDMDIDTIMYYVNSKVIRFYHVEVE